MEVASIAIEAAFRALLPAGTAIAAAAVVGPGDDLLGAELAAAAGMAPGRRAEFAAGRRCARRALAELGLPATAIAIGPDRAPALPPGVRGTISHATGVAVAAMRAGAAGIGLDLEPADDLPGEVLPRVCIAGEEYAGPTGLPAARWARVVFSAKESAYKALARDVGRFIDFGELRVVPGTGGLLRFSPAAGVADLGTAMRLTGAWTLAAGYVLTAAWL